MKRITREFLLDGKAVRLERQDREGGHFTLHHNPSEDEQTSPPSEIPGQLLRAEPGWVQLRIGDVTRRVRLLRHGDEIHACVDGESYCFSTPRRGRGGSAAGGSGRIESPMPGSILEVLVADGESVTEGQDLLVVEAMKMEHRMKAAHPGTVHGLKVKAGDQVGAGQVLLEVVPEA